MILMAFSLMLNVHAARPARVGLATGPFHAALQPKRVGAMKDGERQLVDLGPFEERAPKICAWLLERGPAREIRDFSGQILRTEMNDHQVIGWVVDDLLITHASFKERDRPTQYGQVQLNGRETSLLLFASYARPDEWTGAFDTGEAKLRDHWTQGEGLVAEALPAFYQSLMEIEGDEIEPTRFVRAFGKLGRDERGFTLEAIDVRLKIDRKVGRSVSTQDLSLVHGRLLEDEDGLYIRTRSGFSRRLEFENTPMIGAGTPVDPEALVGHEVLAQGIDAGRLRVYPNMSGMTFLRPVVRGSARAE